MTTESGSENDENTPICGHNRHCFGGNDENPLGFGVPLFSDKPRCDTWMVVRHFETPKKSDGFSHCHHVIFPNGSKLAIIIFPMFFRGHLGKFSPFLNKPKSGFGQEISTGDNASQRSGAIASGSGSSAVDGFT